MQIFINQSKYNIDSSKILASDLIRLSGYSSDKYNIIDEVTSEIYESDDLVNLRPNNKFVINQREEN